MARVRELSFDPQDRFLHYESDASGNQILEDPKTVQQATSPRAETALEALMQCAPGDEPSAAQGDLYPLREIIQDALEDILTERERFIFDAIVVERVSYRALAERLSLSKSQVHRIQEANRNRLAAHLINNPKIRQHLEGM
jgi:DNA-directed RNA polymerase specialized sigma subunit